MDVVQLLNQVESGAVDVGRFLFGNAKSLLAFKRPECAVQRRWGKAGKRKEPVGEVQAGTQRAAWNVFLGQGTAEPHRR